VCLYVDILEKKG